MFRLGPIPSFRSLYFSPNAKPWIWLGERVFPKVSFYSELLDKRLVSDTFMSSFNDVEGDFRVACLGTEPSR